jgi:hypothetical protein
LRLTLYVGKWVGMGICFLNDQAYYTVIGGFGKKVSIAIFIVTGAFPVFFARMCALRPYSLQPTLPAGTAAAGVCVCVCVCVYVCVYVCDLEKRTKQACN